MKPQSQHSPPFLKNVLTLITGNAIALIIPILMYPLLSRIFTTEDYALFGLYFSAFSFLEIASAGRYDFAVIMPKQDDDAINIVAGGLIISLLYSLLILLLVVFFRSWLAAQFNNLHLANWLFFLPIGLFFISISKLCNNWLIRKKKFKTSSFNKASQKFGETSAQSMLGFFAVGNGLILGDIVGRFFNALLSLYQSIKAGFDKAKISKSVIRQELRRYAEFPKFNILPSMLNTLAGMLPVFIISSHYSIEVSGSFNFSRIILSAPFALIAAGISQVLMQQISESKHEGKSIYIDLLSLASKLLFLSVAGVIILYFFAPQLFEIFFGKKWELSGEYTSILIFSYAISFIVSPFSILLAVLGKIKLLGAWQLLYFLASSSLWLFSDLPIEKFLVALVIVDMFSYSIYGLFIYIAVRSYETHLTLQQ